MKTAGEPNKILMIFLDGVGIGKNDPSSNPFVKYGFKTFTELFGAVPTLDSPVLYSDNRYIFPSDATLGVEGLPQSGTGQTAIFCGFNAAKFIGKHFGPYPYSTTVELIAEQNIFRSLQKLKIPFTFANAYPDVFLDYFNLGRKRLSVTTLSCSLNNMKLKTSEDLTKGSALTAEITNERWNKKLGYNLPVISPEIAAERLLKIASDNSFTLYEFFLTDHLGHGRIADEFDKIYNDLDRFLFTVISKLDPENMTLVICSDHGNFEDISVKSHTLNPALTVSAGKHSRLFFENIKDLTQFKTLILNLLK
ncbi:MAG: alkaline phosphatase family protein [Ignavibacteriaceae bacterium]